MKERKIFMKNEKNLMLRTELIRAIGDRFNITNSDAKTIYEGFENVVYDALSDGKDICLFNGIKLKIIDQPAAVKRNPRTGEAIDVPAKKAIKAKFSQKIKDIINN